MFLSTTIIFPNSVARAKAQGLDVRLDVPLHHGFSANLSYSNSEVVEIGPINGGLFLSDDFIQVGPGTRFAPDHDHRNTGSFVVTYTKTGAASGPHFPDDVKAEFLWNCPTLIPPPPHALPGADLVNFDTGRLKPRYLFGWSSGLDLIHHEKVTLGAKLDVQNLTNRQFAFNWSNPFCGTHLVIHASSQAVFNSGSESEVLCRFVTCPPVS